MVVDYYKPENFFKSNFAYQSHKEFFNELLDLFNQSEEVKDHITGITIQNEEQTACSLIFIQSQKTVISILLLCNEGNRSDAGILLRSLYEYYVQCKFIKMEKQGILFLDYYWVGLKKIIDMSDNDLIHMKIKGSREYDTFTEYVNERYESVKKKYLNKNGKIRDRWSKLNLRVMAEMVGEENSYDQVMKTFSPYVHCDVLGMIDMMIPGEKTTTFDNSPKIESIDLILRMSCEFFGRIVAELALIFDVPIPNYFKQFVKRG